MAPVAYRPVEPTDLPALVDLFNDSNRADDVPQVVEVDELDEELSSDHTSMATDTRVAVDGDALVGAVYTTYLPSDTRLERCYIQGAVAPSHRGRGIGRELVSWAIEHGSGLLRSGEKGLPMFLRANAYEQCDADRRLFTRLGFQPVRWFEELLRPLTDLPDVPAVDGVSVLPWPADRDEELRLVRNLTFADHWGSTPTTVASWHDQVHGFASRTDLSFIAVDAEDRVIAICKNSRYEADDTVTGRRDAWISTLGTLAEWRGKGVASALVAASLHAFADAGLTHASIGVDGDSPTGAARLYKSLGFVTSARSTTFQLDVTA